MAYGKGFGAVQDAIEAANAAGNFISFNVTHPIQNPWNMQWKDDPKDKKAVAKHTVRFLTDDVITIPFHNFIATREGGHADFVDTSELEGELRRPDYIFQNFKNDKGKALRPTRQTIGLVVERVQDPKTKEWSDVTREFEVLSDPADPNSEKVTVEWPAFWIIKQGMRFWGQVNTYYSELGTTTNRNFTIVRSGQTAQNTSYTVMPGMTEDGATALSLAEQYDIPVLPGFEHDPAQGWIVEWIERRGSVDWFKKLTGETKTEERPTTVSKMNTKSAPASDEPNEEPPSSEAVDNLKERLKGAKKYSIAK